MSITVENQKSDKIEIKALYKSFLQQSLSGGRLGAKIAFGSKKVKVKNRDAYNRRVF